MRHREFCLELHAALGAGAGAGLEMQLVQAALLAQALLLLLVCRAEYTQWHHREAGAKQGMAPGDSSRARPA